MIKMDLIPPPSGDETPPSINSLTFLYSKNNNLQFSPQHGTRIAHSQMIRLDYPAEFLTWVHGVYYTGRSSYNYNDDVVCVSSITFETNKATYGPFGGISSKPYHDSFVFDYRLGSGDSINGFHGTVNRDGFIGIYLQPQPHPAASPLHVKLESDDPHSE
ncbi:hypothetical protein DM860_009857 [Cuscuta australis]|uniref:Jacalin-type lectin domain-containing protein n=1 Tax=Cuscuta australis TaxID=267555 RepID=A0A328DBD1_9ASTE|nr:hypothetical protein DM860_009857 [Cuscuta australis]